jgi:hypothetical protein
MLMSQNGTSQGNTPQPEKKPQSFRPRSRFEEEDDGEWEELDVGSGSGLKKLIKKLTKNPALALGVVAGVLLLAVLVLGFTLGWFGGQSAPVATQPPPQMPVPPPQPVKQAEPVKPAEVAKEAPKSEEKKPLPEDVSTWKKAEYVRARKENDPKLLLAITYLSQNKKGSDAVARGLADLLKPPPPEQPETPQPTTGPQPPAGSPGAPGALPPGTPPGPMTPPDRKGGPGVPGPRPAEATPPAQPPRVEQPRSGEFAKVIEGIILGLGDNDSETAKTVLQQIVTGEFITEDDKIAGEAALKALVAHPNTENDAFLIRVITEPEKVRSADRKGTWTTKDVRTAALESVKKTTSIGLRTRLAQITANRVLGRAGDGDPLRDLLFAADPLNCGAQIVFYKKEIASDNASKENKNKMESQLATYSANALTQLLKIPENGSLGSSTNPLRGGQGPMGGLGPMGGRPDAPREFTLSAGQQFSTAGGTLEVFDPTLSVAGLLWSPKTCDLLLPTLDELRSLERESDLIILASTIPQDSVRAALAKLFQRRWLDGTKTLDSVGFPDKLVTDPGLTVVVKMMPRKDNKNLGMSVPLGAPAPRAPRAAKPGAQPPKEGETLKPVQRRALAEQTWFDTSAKLASAWRKRFQAAALAQKKAEEESGNPTDAQPKVPPDFVFAADAKILASYHVLWPDDAPKELENYKPARLEIHYLYAEEANKPKKAVGYYARQVQGKLSDAHVLDGALWLDGLRSVTQEGRRRAIDVFISRPNNPIGQPADFIKSDTEVDLAIEVLTIEIKDPRDRD